MWCTRRSTFTNFEAKLGNLSPTCFPMKQATGCRGVFSHRLHPHIGFEAQTDKPPPTWFGGSNQWFCGPNHQTADAGFEAQTGKPERVVLRPNHKNSSHLFWGQTGRNRWPWFWGWTKKPMLLVFLCIVQTAHSVTRPLDHPATKYPTHAWPSTVLYTKSPTPASIIVAARHATPVTYTPWNKQTWFSKQNK
jgi:hypothetical protein